MALTRQQIEMRRSSIGSSDSGAIVGVNPFRSAYDVWLEKTGRVGAFAGNEATRIGDALERATLEWGIRELQATDVEFSPEQIQIGIFSAHLDAVGTVDDERVDFEAKTAGCTSPLSDDWGAAGTNEIPDSYIIQVQHQLFVANLNVAYVPAFLPPRGFVLFRVERDDDLIDAFSERCELFWRDHVLADVPPDDSIPSYDSIKRMIRRPKSETRIDDSLVQRWLMAKEATKDCKKIEEEIERELLASLGDAECGVYGGGIVTYLEQTRKGYTVEPTTFRVLRHKKGGLK